MNNLFPPVRIAANASESGFSPCTWPDKPQIAKFSVALASCLIDLCAQAESGSEPFVIHRNGADVFVAFRSDGDPAAIFNVSGETRITAVSFGGGRVYGPLLEAYCGSVQGRLPELPVGEALWLTGHGMGAAFALLAAAELQRVLGVYTFGAPRVGDLAFARSHACPVFRVVNHLDVVATLPTAWKWRHAGELKLIDSGGRLREHPNPFNRLPDLLRQNAWLGELLGQGLASGFLRPVYSLLQRVLEDHALAAYQRRLHMLQSWYQKKN